MANTALRITELDFSGIRTNLINFLKQQDTFTDYDFTGSGLSVLIDILAYNTHMNAYYLNMVANEAFLDTAQLRSSVISHAKHIDYVPGSMKGAQATVNLIVTPQGSEDTITGTMTLPKYTRFISEPLDGISYIFTNTSANTAIKNSGAFTFPNIVLTQGEIVTQQYSMGNQTDFSVPSSNVDTSTITVTVQESSTNTSTSVYNQALDITTITANSKIFFIEEDSDSSGQYTLSFGDGVLGYRPTQDNIITLKYLDTNGSWANKSNNFTSSGAISGYSANIIVESLTSAAGGSDKETIEEVRKRAPIAFTVQNRVVTKNDYQTILLDEYPNIDAISVWSGDENSPPVYGKVFISLKPKQDYVISLLDKQNIQNDILTNKSVLTVTPEIVDPDYTYMLINATVNYDPNLTLLDETEIKQLIYQSILDYKTSELETFNSTFRISKLQKLIDNAHESIIGSSVRLYLQKRVDIIINQDKIYSMNFNTPLYRGVIEDKFYTYPDVTVLDSDGISRQVYIEDTPNSLTGLDGVIILASGSGYLDIPDIIISGDGSGATAAASIVNGRVNSITVTNRGIDYTTAMASIISDSGTGATAQVTLQAKNGTLRSFYYKGNGEKVIVNDNIGTIDYVNGTIQILSLNVLAVEPNDRYDTNVLTFNAVPFNDVIVPVRNRILDIDDSDFGSITINLVPETT